MYNRDARSAVDPGGSLACLVACWQESTIKNMKPKHKTGKVDLALARAGVKDPSCSDSLLKQSANEVSTPALARHDGL